MVLETNRLILREFRVEDFEAVHAYASDPEVCAYTDWGPNTHEETRAFLEDVLATQTKNPRTQFILGIIKKDSDEVIGACSLTSAEPSQGEIGYSLIRDYWGYGFATEAAQALLSFAFTELHLHRVFATCRPSNIGSYRVLEKIGMRREGHLREHRFFKGKWHDSFLYAILQSELRSESEAP